MKIDLQGDCTTETAEALWQRLTQALKSRQATTLSFARITHTDLSFFQLIVAATVSFRRQGINLELLPDLPPQFSEYARFCGLSRVVQTTPLADNLGDGHGEKGPHR